MNFLLPLDHDLFHFLNAWAVSWVGDLFAILTWWGHFAICGSVIALWAWVRRANLERKPLKKVVAFALALAVLVVLLKMGLDRARPASVFGLEAVHVKGEILRYRSFPSGHTATALWALFTGALLGFRKWELVILGVLALLVAISRVVVGAHFPSDVLASLIIASGTFALFYVIYPVSNKGEAAHEPKTNDDQ